MSPSSLDSTALFEWCRIPADQLENHPQKKVPIKIVRTPEDVHLWAAQEMIREVKYNNSLGNPTRWILFPGLARAFITAQSSV